MFSNCPCVVVESLAHFFADESLIAPNHVCVEPVNKPSVFLLCLAISPEFKNLVPLERILIHDLKICNSCPNDTPFALSILFVSGALPRKDWNAGTQKTIRYLGCKCARQWCDPRRRGVRVRCRHMQVAVKRIVE